MWLWRMRRLEQLHVHGKNGSDDTGNFYSETSGMRVLGVNDAHRGFTQGAWRTQTSWWPAAARPRTSSSCWQATRTGRPGICSEKSRAATGGSSQLPPTSFCHLCKVCPCIAPSCSLARQRTMTRTRSAQQACCSSFGEHGLLFALC